MPRYTIPRTAHCEGGALAMAGILAVVAFAVALIFQLASVDKGVLLNPGAFTIIGLLCLAVHLAWPYTPWHRPPP
jgi:hypothetical protein